MTPAGETPEVEAARVAYEAADAAAREAKIAAGQAADAYALAYAQSVGAPLAGDVLEWQRPGEKNPRRMVVERMRLDTAGYGRVCPELEYFGPAIRRDGSRGDRVHFNKHTPGYPSMRKADSKDVSK